jgi:alkaline phosphatase D
VCRGLRTVIHAPVEGHLPFQCSPFFLLLHFRGLTRLRVTGRITTPSIMKMLHLRLLLILAVLCSAGPLCALDVTHGPILGLPGADSMRVWARTSQPGTFTVRYGTAAGRLDQRSAPVTTTIDRDCTGWIELRGLQPDTKHFYEVVADGQAKGPGGTFRTLPAADTTRNAPHNPKGLFNFRFEFGSCANQNPEHGIGHELPAYTTMNRELRDKIHFAIMNGDWLYEELREHPPAEWQRAQGLTDAQVPRVVKVMPTIVGVWENYKLYLSRAANLTEWHRHTPTVFTFDDHELVNDIWGTGTIGHRHRRTVFRDIGTEAWYHYLGWANPVAFNHPIHYGFGHCEEGSDVLVDREADFTKVPLAEMSNLHIHWGKPTDGVNEIQYDDDSGHPNSRVYHVVEVLDKHTLRIMPPTKVAGSAPYSIGRRSYGSFRVANCEYFLVDTRSHRSMHDIRRRSDPNLSMLGPVQRDWLIAAMKASDADFLFVVSSVPFMVPHIGAGGFEFDEQNKEESWTGFYHERENLIAFWETLNRPVFVLTGDLHNSFAIKITDRIWEFCSGPHNSVNHVPKNDEGDRPATGKFKFGPRECDIRWSTYILPDIPRPERMYPHYCVAQVNNVFNMPPKVGDTRWVAYPHPQVVFQYFDGRTGELQYAESISMPR